MFGAVWLMLLVAGVVGGEPLTSHQDTDDPVVAAFLRAFGRFTRYLGQHQLDTAPIGSFTFGSSLLSGDCTSGLLSNLSSFVVDDQLIQVNKTQSLRRSPHEGMSFRYKLWLHMDDLVFAYHYNLKVLALSFLSGDLTVSPVQNTGAVSGEVKLSSEGCTASLDEAQLLSLDLLRIRFDEESLLHSALQLVSDFILNVGYSGLRGPIQALLGRLLSLDSFKADFSHIFCREFASVLTMESSIAR